MTGATASTSITVTASPEEVYGLVSDLPRMGEWSPENTGGRWVGRRRGPAVGARFVGTNKGARRWWPTTTLVTDATPGRRFAFETRLGPVMAAEWVYDIAPVEDGGCSVTETWTDHRPGALVAVGKLVTGVDDRVAFTHSMLETTLQRLKATAENGR
ncbi:SRPBCC family protein [Actinomycetospora endophytica]|uniref:SRPBCC family protein n=1 Tax=Actinomycetospora endophytica TaxID=2291215 RepID=A0ABS8P9L9_9PSEU|nr:SRPBCC family protein [Actinomycetospora endophytica]MCD2194794.1 SRPBCC family protein [Actinomycetospora endophytica]